MNFLYPDTKPFKDAVSPMHEAMLRQHPDFQPSMTRSRLTISSIRQRNPKEVSVYEAAEKCTYSLLNVLAGVSLIAMVALTCWQVFTRYVLQNPSPWSEELVAYLFAWASLLGASIITGERGHDEHPHCGRTLQPGIQKLLAIFSELDRLCLLPDLSWSTGA